MPIFYIFTILVPCLTPGIVGLGNYNRLYIYYSENLLRNVAGPSVDFKHLIHIFTAICPYSNDSELQQSNITGNLTYNYLGSECRRSCKPDCIKAHNCCPRSVFGYLHYACVDIGIFPHGKSKSYYMIDRCPSTYTGDHETIEKCESHHNNIAPVTSYRTKLTYRNTYCASCNGETVFIPWQVSIECKSKPPNLFRSSMNLKTIFQKHDCNASFQLKYAETKYRPTECTTSTLFLRKVIYTSCNMTGLWNYYDESINWACANLDSHFYKFKNVFCYICNPSLASMSTRAMIGACNTTGTWKNNDKILENLCKSQPKLRRSSPFKNIYCLLCNGYEISNRYYEWPYHKEKYRIREDVTEAGTSVLRLTAENFSISDMLMTLESIDQIFRNGPLLWNATRIPNYQTFNRSEIKTLVESYVAVCGDKYLCAIQSNYTRKVPEASNPICGNCSCDTDCVENYNCCPDFILQIQPYTCVSHNSFMSITTSRPEQHVKTSVDTNEQDSRYRAIYKCSNRRSKYLHLCEDETYIRDNILSNIPLEVQDQRYTYYYKTYLNVFCFLCNHYKDSRKHLLRFNIQLHCNTLIDSHLIDSVNVLLNISKPTCNISFVPSQIEYCKSQYVGHPWTDSRSDILTFVRNETYSEYVQTALYSHCNQTGFWGKYIQEIEHVCEGVTESILALSTYKFNSKVYKNFACFICNPSTPNSDYGSNTIISTCSNSSQQNVSEFAEMQCMARRYNSIWLPYKNFFCTDCNLPPLREMVHHVSLQPGATPTAQSSLAPGETPTVRPVNTGGTLRFLFSIHQNDWLKLETHTRIGPTTRQCDNGTYDQALGSCRQLYCDEDRVLENETCILHSEIAENIDYVFSVLLAQVNSSCYWQSGCDNQTLWLPKLCQDIPAAVTEMLGNSTPFNIFQCNVSTNAECDENKTVSAANISQVVVSFFVEILSTDELTTIERLLVSSLNKEYIVQNLNGEEFTFVSKPLIELQHGGIWNEATAVCMVHFTYFDGYSQGRNNLAYEPYVVSRLLFCLQVELTHNEFELDNKSGCIIVKQNGLNKSEYEFRLHKSSARVCQYQQEKNPVHVNLLNNKLWQTYRLFSRFCISLSLVGLLLTFLTYCIFPTLRTIPGKNIMTLSINLFIAQFILEFGFPLVKNKLLCTLSGVLIHYFWLATFFAMNVCSFHSFKTFCINFYESHSSNSLHKPWLKYVCYTQGVPLVVIAVTIAVHLATSQGTFIGYGKGRCFLSDKYSLIFSFIVPVAILFVINIVFFIAVFHKIRSTPNIQGSSDKRDAVVFFRLCALVGVTWPLQIMDGVFDFSIFSFVATVFNGLQGVDICISYVCNTRVMGLYTSVVSRWRHNSSQSFGNTGMEFQITSQST